MQKKGSIILVALLAFGAVLLVASFALVDVKVERLTSLSEFDDFEENDIVSLRQRIKELEKSFDKILDAPTNVKQGEPIEFNKDIDRINLALNALHEQLEAYQERQQPQQVLLDQ